ncbi:type II toxin-antitoxin system RelE/ParE family toxin [Tistrella mobilis]|uniref:type II toxin-antitoxin system RelE/ParE family toxin n=1 Tax=Tistrella mobilis TaxID=171437 RepID=UPI003557893E
MKIHIQAAAADRLDEIYRYTRDHWGDGQAERYITGLFEAFEGILTRRTTSRRVDADFGIDGFYFRYQRHYVYWRPLQNGDVGIVTILHERMHQLDRFRDDAV